MMKMMVIENPVATLDRRQCRMIRTNLRYILAARGIYEMVSDRHEDMMLDLCLTKVELSGVLNFHDIVEIVERYEAWFA